MQYQNTIKLLLSFLIIAINGCAMQPEPIKIAESDVKLFGKLKTWEIEKISERVYAFRYTFYRNFFLVGDEGVIVTDPLTVDAASILNKEIKKITDKPIKYLAYSHSHWDHITGGQIFKDQGAEVVAQQKCKENWINNPNPNVVEPDTVFQKEYTISVGGASLEMHYFGPSHDNCRVVFLIQPDRIMFIADDANPPNGLNMIYGAGLADTYLFNLVPYFLKAEKLAKRKRVKSIIGSHMSFKDQPMNLVAGTIGSIKSLKEQRLFYQYTINAVQKALNENINPEEIPDHLIKKGILRDTIIGFDESKMKVLYTRMTNYLITGE